MITRHSFAQNHLLHSVLFNCISLEAEESSVSSANTKAAPLAFSLFLQTSDSNLDALLFEAHLFLNRSGL